MKVLLITTTSNSVINFRSKLIQFLIEKGNDVFVISGDDVRREDIEKLGASFYLCEANNRSINPFAIVRYKHQLRDAIRNICPDIVFTFQLKPNFYGTLMSKRNKVSRVFAMVEGAGDLFAKKGFKWLVLKMLALVKYKAAFKVCEKVFFLNNDDKREFIELKLLDANKAVLVNGIGVDLRHFSYKPPVNKHSFLMVARMLETKGVIDYCECARRVKQRHPEAVFNYIGSEGDLKIADIKPYIDDGAINYLGTFKDIRPFMEDCLLFVLPSFYREGLPMSIMEAQSIGRCVLTTNNVGCKETVIEGHNGFLVENRDVDALVSRCCYALDHFDDMVRMGLNARRYAEEKWNCDTINAKIYDVIS